MSVHQESLDMAKSAERVEEPPDLEYAAMRNESLTMFGAAIGGAVLGMLLTLLVLAIINGGTLSFSGGERLDVLEASVQRIDENVGAVSYNVDVISQQATEIAEDLATVEGNLRAQIVSGQEDTVALEESVAQLSETSDQFNGFLLALSEALRDVSIPAEAEAGTP